MLNEIAENVVDLINSFGKLKYRNATYTIDLIQMQISQPINNSDQLENIVAPYRTKHCHFTSLSFANKMWNVIIKIECEDNDSIVKSIFDELKNAKAQFSHNRPGLIAVEIEGVHPEEWVSLESGSSLEIMTRQFLENESCPFIHTITTPRSRVMLIMEITLIVILKP